MSADRRSRIVISIFDDVDNRHYAGGGPAVVGRIAGVLAEEHDVLVVTAGDRWSRSRRHGAQYLHLPVAWAGPRAGQVLWALVLPFVVLFARYDLWIESFTPPVSSNLVPMLTRRPVIGLAQALSGREMARRYGTQLPARVERLLLPRYEDVVVLNDLDRRVVEECAPRTRVHVIPNIVDAPDRPSTDAGAGTYALFLGRIDVSQKGLDLLLHAYRSKDDSLPPLVLAGSGRPEEQERLDRLLATTEGDVRWVGSVQGAEREQLFEGAAFVVVPSREESFSLVALEAMVRGRPVIRFDLPQLGWIPAGCGDIVPCFDADRLRSAVRDLWTDVDRRSCAGRRAAAVGAERVGPRAMDSYRSLVDRAMASPRASDAGSVR